MPDRWQVIDLQHADLRLSLLPGIGGRLWDVKIFGHSLLFQNPDLVGRAVDDTRLAALPTRSPQFRFPLWGGEKTWIAPDTSWADGAPFPTLDTGAYAVTARSGRHVELVSAICPHSQLSISRRIRLASPSSWSILHRVTNHGITARLTGIWSVMMLKTPVKIAVAMDVPKYRPVFGSAAPMVALHDACVVAACERQQEFKVGMPNPDGGTLIRCGTAGHWMSCTVPPPKPSDRFAHHFPFEIFNSGDYAYCEAEWHSSARTLAPGETLNFLQEFRVFAGIDAVQAVTPVPICRDLLSCMS